MSRKTLFVIKAAAVSIVLFLLWPWVSKAYAAALSETVSAIRALFGGVGIDISREVYSLFLIPPLAVIVSASGSSLARKAKFAALATAIIFGFDALSMASGVSDLARGGGGFGASLGVSLATVLYNTLCWALPIFAVVLFIRGRPAELWESVAPPTAKASRGTGGKKQRKSKKSKR
ncbi:MAG: hypothetical protein ACYC1U_10045 [Candidatus Aquicultorales bacterium]